MEENNTTNERLTNFAYKMLASGMPVEPTYHETLILAKGLAMREECNLANYCQASPDIMDQVADALLEAQKRFQCALMAEYEGRNADKNGNTNEVYLEWQPTLQA